jgi:hypothetical protein
VGLCGLAMSAALLVPLPAAGAPVPPQRIYEDLADNGRLDGEYSQADIARALNVRQIIGTDAPKLRRPVAAATTRPHRAKKSTAGLPFTGLDLALLTLGGGPLLLIGFGLRRRLGTEAHRMEVVGS